MSILAEKIKFFRKKCHLTQKELANLLEIAPTAVSAWEVGRNKPLVDHIDQMAKIFQIKKSQLLGEESSPNVDSQVFTQKDQLTDLFKNLNSEDKNKLLEMAQEMQEDTSEYYEITVTTKLAAGIGYAFNDYDQEKVIVGNRPPRYDVASFVFGDSMEPKYHSGDIVYLADRGLSSYSGEVCAVAYEGKTYIKRLYTEAGYLRLESLNPKYDDIFIDFPPQDGGYIKIYEVIGSDTSIPA
ncbi:XRE family transcriptional regulator [Streptococcus parauberis]|uniref:Transcriptional repressor DicA n=2 Tax=Streptococcus parauberis TaxID=1348 RepID=A0A0E2UAR2_9STRE|nr:XRE family transcriptional regulator [Streptococcus parauberis]AEF26174.1 phage transcriptional repressor [Streptococcus parauberis KCTC 11537]AUT04918.1 Repressor LexA [Streptococcus parauberis]EMF48653.1 Phage transcriptional repressor [Streptococcus parauberis KRS-02109]EMG25007.1 Phage transcriptional repressor [Streptococcus parauberis KRS-02083]MDT2749834.1 XRE family transcriptional regulator [Streptococcus parauberis]